MPLVKRCVEPVYLSRSKVPKNVNNELQCVTNSTLANIIRQLSSLSDHADDLFGEILKDTEIFSVRTHQLTNRVQRLKRSVTQLDSAVEEVLLQEVNTRKQFKSTIQKDAQLFTIESRPKSLCDLYAKCDAPPDLRKLNQFRDDNYDCLNYYTNPNYFFELWSREIMNKTEQQKKEINKRRKNKRPKQRAPHHIKEAKSKRDDLQRYKHGKELATEVTRQQETLPQQPTRDVLPTVVQLPPQQQPPPPPNVYEYQSLNLDLLPPPPPPISHIEQQKELPEPEVHRPVEHIKNIPSNVSRTPSMIQVTRPNCAPPPAPIKLLPQHPNIPPIVKDNNIPAAPAPPPLPPPCGDLSQMKLSLSNANGDTASSTTSRMAPNTLLSQINNVKLNPSDNASIASSESSTTAKVDSRSDLLVAIVNGIKLRKVEERREKDKNQKPKVLDVQQIMENAFEIRRKAMEADQDDTDEGDNDDWSDND